MDLNERSVLVSHRNIEVNNKITPKLKFAYNKIVQLNDRKVLVGNNLLNAMKKFTKKE